MDWQRIKVVAPENESDPMFKVNIADIVGRRVSGIIQACDPTDDEMKPLWIWVDQMTAKKHRQMTS